MAKTVSDVLTLVRMSVNDPSSKRFNATEQVRIFNRTMNRMFTERPDIFVGSLVTPPADKGLNDAVPYGDEFAQMHADMIVAEMETVPDEEINQERAAFFDTRARR